MNAQQAPTVLLIQPRPQDFRTSPAAAGMQMSDAITQLSRSSLGGGFLNWAGPAETAPWPLSYDEVIAVHEGEMEIDSDGQTVAAGPGDVLLIPAGCTVVYRVRTRCRAVYVVTPRAPR